MTGLSSATDLGVSSLLSRHVNLQIFLLFLGSRRIRETLQILFGYLEEPAAGILVEYVLVERYYFPVSEQNQLLESINAYHALFPKLLIHF